MTDQSYDLPWRSRTGAERMATLARDLNELGSHIETLQEVVDAAYELIGPCEHVGISLASKRGTIVTSAATSDVPTRADELQQSTGEGPCIDAAFNQALVSVDDLILEERWPEWRPAAATQLGVRSMLCLRLFTHQDRVGALNLYSSNPAAFSVDDIAEATAVAAHAAVALVSAEHVDNLEVALLNRSITSQAVGIVMEKYGLTTDNAFGLIRRMSGNQHVKLRDVAQHIVDETQAAGR